MLGFFKQFKFATVCGTCILLLLSFQGNVLAATCSLRDGSNIQGDIISETPEAIRLKAAFGEVSINMSYIRDCTRIDPSPENPISNTLPRVMRISGSNTIGEKLVPNLLESLATQTGASQTTWIAGTQAEERTLISQDSQGAKLSEAEVKAHGSSTAFQSLLDGSADIGMASRPIKDEEVSALTQHGLGDMTSPNAEHVIALDGLAIIVNPSNLVEKLSIEQIAKIFAGEISNWSDVGGTRGHITVYARDDKSGTYDTFKHLVLDGRHLYAQSERFESSSDLSDKVAADPQGIGFIGLAYIRSAKPLSIALPCGLFYAPEPFNVKTEEYSLSRRLYLYSAENLQNTFARDFLTFALSDNAQSIISDAGFINLDVDVADGSYSAWRAQYANIGDEINQTDLSRLFAMTRTAHRLSVTYRFLTNSASLDSRSMEDARRLSDYLNRPENSNRSIILAGFADSDGPYLNNRRLSTNRAEAVRSALIGRNVDAHRIENLAFSEMAPVACNGDFAGKAKNRRVEVWIR